MAAAVAGERFWEGHGCRVCGETKRYTTSGQCVACTKRRAALRQASFSDTYKAAGGRRGEVTSG